MPSVRAHRIAVLGVAGLTLNGCTNTGCPVPVPDLAISRAADGNLYIVLPRCEGGPDLTGDRASSLKVIWSPSEEGRLPVVTDVPVENRPVLIAIEDGWTNGTAETADHPEERAGVFLIAAMRGAEVLDVSTDSPPAVGMVSTGLLRADIPADEYASRVTHELCAGAPAICDEATEARGDDAPDTALSGADSTPSLAVVLAIIVGGLVVGLLLVMSALRLARLLVRQLRERADPNGTDHNRS